MPNSPADSLLEQHNQLKLKFRKTLSLPPSLERTDAILALSEEIRLLAKALRDQAQREREVARYYSTINADVMTTRASNYFSRTQAIKRTLQRLTG